MRNVFITVGHLSHSGDADGHSLLRVDRGWLDDDGEHFQRDPLDFVKASHDEGRTIVH